MTSVISSSDLCTPARAEGNEPQGPDIGRLPQPSTMTIVSASSNTVTPSDHKDLLQNEEADAARSTADLSSGDKQKSNSTFISQRDASASSSTASSKRGLVSRRGRGLAKPGQRPSSRSSSDNHDERPLQTLAQVTAAAAQETPFETPLLQRSSVTFSPQQEQEEDNSLADGIMEVSK